MKLDIEFAELKAVVKRMRAKRVKWRSQARALPNAAVVEALREGREVKLRDVRFEDSGLLTFGGELVVLYIREAKVGDAALRESRDVAPRFHFSECATMQTMRAQKRMKRFVATNDFSGNFHVESERKIELTTRLKACRHCLIRLNYEGYNFASDDLKSEIWGRFSLVAFFARFGPAFRIGATIDLDLDPKGDRD